MYKISSAFYTLYLHLGLEQDFVFSLIRKFSKINVERRIRQLEEKERRVSTDNTRGTLFLFFQVCAQAHQAEPINADSVDIGEEFLFDMVPFKHEKIKVS